MTPKQILKFAKEHNVAIEDAVLVLVGLGINFLDGNKEIQEIDERYEKAPDFAHV